MVNLQKLGMAGMSWIIVLTKDCLCPSTGTCASLCIFPAHLVLTRLKATSCRLKTHTGLKLQLLPMTQDVNCEGFEPRVKDQLLQTKKADPSLVITNQQG